MKSIIPQPDCIRTGDLISLFENNKNKKNWIFVVYKQ